ncbi:hydroxymethylglutaryl-CoA reductase, class I/II, partial [Tanacetum coccineum]
DRGRSGSWSLLDLLVTPSKIGGTGGEPEPCFSSPLIIHLHHIPLFMYVRKMILVGYVQNLYPRLKAHGLKKHTKRLNAPTSKSLESWCFCKLIVIAGSLGCFNAHFANAVSPIFITAGQDLAQNIQNSHRVAMMEVVNGGKDLSVSVTMPAIEMDVEQKRKSAKEETVGLAEEQKSSQMSGFLIEALQKSMNEDNKLLGGANCNNVRCLVLLSTEDDKGTEVAISTLQQRRCIGFVFTEDTKTQRAG